MRLKMARLEGSRQSRGRRGWAVGGKEREGGGEGVCGFEESDEGGGRERAWWEEGRAEMGTK